MTIQEILDKITILKTDGTNIMPLIVIFFIGAAIMGVFSVLVFRDKDCMGDTKTGRIILGIITAIIAVGLLVGAILLLGIPSTTTELTLNVVTNDSIALTDLTQYFDVSNISPSPYGTQMMLEINYKHQAFAEVITALRAAGVAI